MIVDSIWSIANSPLGVGNIDPTNDVVAGVALFVLAIGIVIHYDKEFLKFKEDENFFIIITSISVGIPLGPTLGAIMAMSTDLICSLR